MSLYQSLDGLCEDILANMSNYQGENSAPLLGPKTGMLDFILSPINRGSNIMVEPLQSSSGKLKQARVVYKQGASDGDWVTGQAAEDAGLCDTSRDREPLETNVLIDGACGMSEPLAFPESKMRLYCQDASAFINDYLAIEMKNGRETLNKAVLAAVDAGAGINYHADDTITAAGSSKSVQLIDSNRLPIYPGFNDILEDYENNFLNGTQSIIGQGLFNSYFRLQDLVCCNDASPFMQSVQQAGLAYFLDQTANGILGSNEILSVAPGSSHLITYNENAHININTELTRHIVIPDPVYGNSLMWDLDIRWNECNKDWTYFIRTYFTVFNTFQTDSFPSGSINREGLTGIHKYLITNS